MHKFSAEIPVSVIVPVYNDACHIERCLNSILNQSIQNIEIIVVNDCSTDSTASICNIFAERYPNKLKVIHNKKNIGLGLSRNIGIAHSLGHYIGFVDSDDWIEIDMYMKLHSIAVKLNSDIVMCDVTLFYQESQKTALSVCLSTEEEAIDIHRYLREGKNTSYAWNKLYRREIWETHQFCGIFYEDVQIVTNLIGYYNHIAYVREPLYTYNKRSGTISSSHLDIRTQDLFIAYKDAVRNSAEQYRKDTEFNIAKRMNWLLSDPNFRIHRAELLETCIELLPYFQENEYIYNDPEVRNILLVFEEKVLQRRVIIAYNGSSFNNSAIKEMKHNWQKYTRGFDFVVLRKGHLGLFNKELSQFLRSLKKENVEEYLRLHYLFENGGFIVQTEIRLCTPIGEIRSEQNFFCFSKDNRIDSRIFGLQAGNSVLSEILKTYEERNTTLPNPTLTERIEFVLKKHGLLMNGNPQKLAGSISILPLLQAVL